MFLSSIAPMVKFEQPVYSVNEYDTTARPVLVLTKPSSINISIQVFTTDGSATGEYILLCELSMYVSLCMYIVPSTYITKKTSKALLAWFAEI